MKHLIVLMAITLGATIQNGFASTEEECKKIGKPVKFHVHGLYIADLSYYDCRSGIKITKQLHRGDTWEGISEPNRKIRVEIFTQSVFTGTTKNGAYVDVGEGMNIDCGGTTFINRQCHCNGERCPTTD